VFWSVKKLTISRVLLGKKPMLGTRFGPFSSEVLLRAKRLVRRSETTERGKTEKRV